MVTAIVLPCKDRAGGPQRRRHTKPILPARHPPPRGMARGEAHPQENRREPLEDAPRACRRHPRRPRRRGHVPVARRGRRHPTVTSPRPCGGGARNASRARPGPCPGPEGGPHAGSRRGGRRRPRRRSRLQAGDRPGAGPGDRVDEPRDPARARPRHRQRDARHARLAAGAPALDRAEPRQPAPEGREHADPVRRQFQLPGRQEMPAGGLRPQPRRQEGQDAGHLRAALRGGRLPGRGRGLPGQHVRSCDRGLPGGQGPEALRHRPRGVRGRPGDADDGADPGGPGARGTRLDLGPEDRRHPQAAEGGRGRRPGPAGARGAGSRRGGGGHGPGLPRRAADGVPEPEAAGGKAPEAGGPAQGHGGGAGGDRGVGALGPVEGPGGHRPPGRPGREPPQGREALRDRRRGRRHLLAPAGGPDRRRGAARRRLRDPHQPGFRVARAGGGGGGVQEPRAGGQLIEDLPP